MGSDLKGWRPLEMSADQAAAIIARGLAKDRDVVSFPLPWPCSPAACCCCRNGCGGSACRRSSSTSGEQVADRAPRPRGPAECAGGAPPRGRPGGRDRPRRLVQRRAALDRRAHGAAAPASDPLGDGDPALSRGEFRAARHCCALSRPSPRRRRAAPTCRRRRRLTLCGRLGIPAVKVDDVNGPDFAQRLREAAPGPDPHLPFRSDPQAGDHRARAARRGSTAIPGCSPAPWSGADDPCPRGWARHLRHDPPSPRRGPWMPGGSSIRRPCACPPT